MTLEGYGKCTLKNNKQRGHLGSAPTTLSGWPHKCRDFQGLILKLPMSWYWIRTTFQKNNWGPIETCSKHVGRTIAPQVAKRWHQSFQLIRFITSNINLVLISSSLLRMVGIEQQAIAHEIVKDKECIDHKETGWNSIGKGFAPASHPRVVRRNVL